MSWLNNKVLKRGATERQLSANEMAAQLAAIDKAQLVVE